MAGLGKSSHAFICGVLAQDREIISAEKLVFHGAGSSGWDYAVIALLLVQRW